MNALKKILVVASVFTATAFSAGSASACDLFSGGGFVANLGACAVPQARPVFRGLDVLNGQMGRPFERGVAAGMNSVVPGSGTVMNGVWQVQNSGGFASSGGFQQPGQPSYPRAPQPPMQQPRLSNFCITQVGAFAGPYNPVGTSCIADTPYGAVLGQIG